MFLYRNKFTGSIPAELANLTNLENLNLLANLLSGAIPSELGNLVNLKTLTLTANRLSGAIPSGLGSLTNLIDLKLANNELSGELPPELASLTNLVDLSLSENQLSGTIPPEWGNLANLWFMSLSSNRLTGTIPSELGNLVNLIELDLSRNLLSGGLPLSLTNLSRLDHLFFEETTLCEPSDAAFQDWLQGLSLVQGTGLTCTATATEDSAELPESVTLLPNYPNPFNPQTTIQYGLPEAALVRFVIYDALGRRVRVLLEAMQSPGWHEVVFDAGSLPSGVYYYHLEVADSFQETYRMLLMK